MDVLAADDVLIVPLGNFEGVSLQLPCDPTEPILPAGEGGTGDIGEGVPLDLLFQLA